MDSIPSTSKTDYINTEEEDNIKEDNAKEEETIEEGERQDWNNWIKEDNFVVEEMEIDDGSNINQSPGVVMRYENNDDIINALNRDIKIVKLLLTGMNAIPSDEEIYAYLEAHVYDRNRIRIVVDELSGVNTSPNHSREPSPIRILEDGKGKRSIDANIEKFVQSVLEIVPKIDVKYLREQAKDFVGQDAAIERFIEGFLDGPQVQEEDEMDPFEEWQREKENYLEVAFPYISPEWIRDQIQSFRDVHGTDNVQFSEKAIQMVELMEKDKSIPTRKDWEKKIKLREEIDKWSKNITVNDMIELYDGNPEPHFIGPNVPKSDLYIKHSLAGLWDAFKSTKVVTINREHKRAKYSFAEAYKELERLPATRMNPRMDKDQIKYPADPCIQFVKERKFVELRSAIEAELKKRETERRQALEEARLSNSLVECGCCFNDECLGEDMVSCKAGHLYCKECIQRSTNVAMGEGNTIEGHMGPGDERRLPSPDWEAVEKNFTDMLPALRAQLQTLRKQEKKYEDLGRPGKTKGRPKHDKETLEKTH